MCACATRSCATSVVTEGHVTPSEMSLGCSLGRPRPITIGNPPFLFSYVVVQIVGGVLYDVRVLLPYNQGRWHSRGGLKNLKIGSLEKIWLFGHVRVK
jgi:hypothetical protein